MINGFKYISKVFPTEEEAYKHLCEVKEYHRLHGKFPDKYFYKLNIKEI
jgi:hypothetical protein